MDEKRVLKITAITMEANDQIYEGKDNKLVLTCEEGEIKNWGVSDKLYDMLTEGERKKIEEFVRLANGLFSCRF